MEEEVGRAEEVKEEVQEENKEGAVEVDMAEEAGRAEEVKKEDVPAEIKEKSKDEKETPLDKMTVTELKEIAREIPGVAGVHSMKKEKLLEIVKKAKGIRDEKPGKKKRKEAAKQGVGVKRLKRKIVRLKEEKKRALQAKDKDRVDIFRRRINRLKKKTRKTAQA
jgi:protein-arginine kinase activator protein McsA